ncbi:hypothetical protein B0H19DRAFT_968390 [Mycena capillaripes]|nr:hypothetical protein B0H19DRAFT_968390 [Mycena capillaripes]
MYNELSTDEEKDDFFSKYGAQWTEFARIDYFDLVRYTIVDPMHNLLLGVAKNQWFTRWIETGTLRGNTPQTFRELNTVHEFLESFESPLWAGCLPLRVGEAAGGSLSADEYKFATTGPWAVVQIPLVWERFREEAKADYEAALKRYPVSLAEYKKKLKVWETARKKGDKKARRPREPKRPAPRMQEGEDRNFLRFAAALKILVGSSITLYGKDEMKPNHHWAVHIPDQALDYGPLYGIWAFLTERLNKVLKNLNSNNWGNGLLEVSMMREFHRTAQLDGMVCGTDLNISTLDHVASTVERNSGRDIWGQSAH